jgi:putative nucleotidyltransferase with HDIG domain
MIRRMDSVMVALQAALGARKLYGAEHAAVKRQTALAIETLIGLLAGEHEEEAPAPEAPAAAPVSKHAPLVSSSSSPSSSPSLPPERRALRVVRLDNALLFGDSELPSNGRLGDVLIPILVRHGVEWVEFHPGLTRNELTDFIVQLEAAPSLAASVGTPHVEVGRLGRSSRSKIILPGTAGAGVGAGVGAGIVPATLDRDEHVQQLRQIWNALRGIAGHGLPGSGGGGGGSGGGSGAGRGGFAKPDQRLSELVESIRLAVAVGADVCQQLADVKGHDEYTFVHTVNVAILSAALGEAVGMNADAVFDLTMAALLHDVGKQHTPLTILNKPGKLDTGERQKMERHTVDGAAILLSKPGIPDVAPIVAFEHHANLDGTGYPSLIRNKRPHLASQIVHVADVFDALRTNRPYRAAMDPEKVRAILMEGAGKAYDAALVNLFLDRVVKFALTSAQPTAPPKAA